MRSTLTGYGAWLALIAVTGCDEGRELSGTAAPPAIQNDYKARIDALTPGQRDALFLRAIRDAKQDCQGVVGSAYNGEHFGMPAWVARCSDGRDWMVMVGANGQAHVARREEAPAKEKGRR
jgi:hypothetical protein